jgi:hypothetical protein
MSWEAERIREEARQLMATIDGDEKKIEKRRRRKIKAQIGDEASPKEATKKPSSICRDKGRGHDAKSRTDYASRKWIRVIQGTGKTEGKEAKMRGEEEKSNKR